MTEIENEEKFWDFMDKNGPNARNSKNNYISWLRFIDLGVLLLVINIVN